MCGDIGNQRQALYGILGYGGYIHFDFGADQFGDADIKRPRQLHQRLDGAPASLSGMIKIVGGEAGTVARLPNR